MARQQVSQVVAERRCPNCGTRVARDAESCFMCGHDLRIQRKRRQRVSWVDALLVVAVLAVLVVWWRIAAQPRPEQAASGLAIILPDDVPLATPTPVVTLEPATAEPPTPTPIPTPSAGGVIRHTVRQGETLLGIAGQYNVTVEEIQAANSLTGVLIRAGDELIIPVQLPAPSSEPATGEPTGQTVESRFEYTVTPGDTVVSIAARFGSTVDAILQANGLGNNDFIRPGQVLLIPVREVPAEVLAAGPAEDAPANPPFYPEPRLIGPPDDATLARTEPILLRWVSVDVLAPNEWYVLLIYPISGAARNFPSIWTKATSFRLDGDLAPGVGENATYVWRVSVVRVKPGVNNQYALEPASPPSALRSFAWR